MRNEQQAEATAKPAATIEHADEIPLVQIQAPSPSDMLKGRARLLRKQQYTLDISGEGCHFFCLFYHKHNRRKPRQGKAGSPEG